MRVLEVEDNHQGGALLGPLESTSSEDFSGSWFSSKSPPTDCTTML